jgi:hypothetical protein
MTVLVWSKRNARYFTSRLVSSNSRDCGFLPDRGRGSGSLSFVRGCRCFRDYLRLFRIPWNFGISARLCAMSISATMGCSIFRIHVAFFPEVSFGIPSELNPHKRTRNVLSHSSTGPTENPHSSTSYEPQRRCSATGKDG